ncbi:Ig-like domain-containing protein [Corynebacterium sp. P7003]|uniref:Ig-like domain-containing protein n=1 Tax=Corynebacterium pygosceleis TaxID=2800406 RepID=A0ABT3WV08_9CORY|nr:Ig-like domain-containing protein [Corynebacterium pygosceleis]MCX7444814.1 Ig-like domain-containing protein [Corynebacterium pygosceleis]
MNRVLRTTIAAVSTLCLTTTILQATATAADTTDTTRTVEVEQTCTTNFAWFGNNKQDVTLSPDTVTVTYPESVSPGEQFTVTLQPGQWNTTAQLSRIRYDIALPTTGTVTGLTLTDAGENVAGTDAEISVTRVDADGEEDPNGSFARISAGNLTIDNGPNADDGNNPATGLTVAKNTDFRLPGVTVTMTAPDEFGGTVTTGLRGAGTEGGTPTLSLIEIGPGWTGYNNDAISCTSDAAGAVLTTTRVDKPLDTTVTFTDVPSGELDHANPTAPLTVTVARATSGSPVPSGQVVFTVGDRKHTVDIDPDGTATLTGHEFPAPDGREPLTTTVTAEYTGVDGRYNASAQATTEVTVAAAPLRQVRGTLALDAELNTSELTATGIPATLTATVGTTDDAELPDGLTVTFRNGDGELGTAAVTDGTAVFTTTVPNAVGLHTFTATVGDTTTDTVRFTGTSATSTLPVTPSARTELALDTGAGEATVGDTLDLTATYGTVGGGAAGAEIIFRADGVRIGTATTGDNGVAVLPHTLTRSGDVTFTAVSATRTDDTDGRVYPTARSTERTVTVAGPTAHGTTTTLSRVVPGDTDTPTAGTAFDLTANVTTGTAPVTTGTVSFYADDVLIGSADTDDTGAATLSHTFSVPGTVTLRAEFTGSGTTATRYGASVSAPLELTVTARDIVVTNPGEGTDENTGNPGAQIVEFAGRNEMTIIAITGLLGLLGTMVSFLTSLPQLRMLFGFLPR